MPPSRRLWKKLRLLPRGLPSPSCWHKPVANSRMPCPPWRSWQPHVPLLKLSVSVVRPARHETACSPEFPRGALGPVHPTYASPGLTSAVLAGSCSIVIPVCSLSTNLGCWSFFVDDTYIVHTVCSSRGHRRRCPMSLVKRGRSAKLSQPAIARLPARRRCGRLAGWLLGPGELSSDSCDSGGGSGVPFVLHPPGLSLLSLLVRLRWASVHVSHQPWAHSALHPRAFQQGSSKLRASRWSALFVFIVFPF